MIKNRLIGSVLLVLMFVITINIVFASTTGIKQNCLDQTTCKNIDEAWMKISLLLDKNFGQNVWSVSIISNWSNYNIVYPSTTALSSKSTTTSKTATPSVTTGTTKTSSTQTTVTVQATTVDSCINEVKKIVKASNTMISWEKYGMQSYGPSGNIKSLPNADKACDKNGGSGCCGTYTWHVMNIARNSYGLKVIWDPWHPHYIKTGHFMIPGEVFRSGEASFLPGDIIVMTKSGTGCNHITIVGPPIPGKVGKYYMIDYGTRKSSISNNVNTYIFPDFIQNNPGNRLRCNSGVTPIQGLSYVYRVIPECIGATSRDILETWKSKGYAKKGLVLPVNTITSTTKTVNNIADPVIKNHFINGVFNKIGGIQFLEKVESIAKSFGANPVHLLTIICAESFFNPQQKTGSAFGLIQWNENDLNNIYNKLSQYKSLPLTKDKVLKMSAIEQLDLIPQYFKQQNAWGKNDANLKNIGDLYLLVFTPSGIGKSLEHVLYSKNTTPNTYSSNKGMDTNNDGEITIKEVREFPYKTAKSCRIDITKTSIFK